MLRYSDFSYSLDLQKALVLIKGNGEFLHIIVVAFIPRRASGIIHDGVIFKSTSVVHCHLNEAETEIEICIYVSKSREKSYGSENTEHRPNSSSQLFLIRDWGASLCNPGLLAGERANPDCIWVRKQMVPDRWTKSQLSRPEAIGGKDESLDKRNDVSRQGPWAACAAKLSTSVSYAFSLWGQERPAPPHTPPEVSFSDQDAVGSMERSSKSPSAEQHQCGDPYQSLHR